MQQQRAGLVSKGRPGYPPTLTDLRPGGAAHGVRRNQVHAECQDGRRPSQASLLGIAEGKG